MKWNLQAMMRKFRACKLDHLCYKKFVRIRNSVLNFAFIFTFKVLLAKLDETVVTRKIFEMSSYSLKNVSRKKEKTGKEARAQAEKWKMHVNWYNMAYLLWVRLLNIVFFVRECVAYIQHTDYVRIEKKYYENKEKNRVMQNDRSWK